MVICHDKIDSAQWFSRAKMKIEFWPEYWRNFKIIRSDFNLHQQQNLDRPKLAVVRFTFVYFVIFYYAT